jgi:hypothetical protein
MGIILVNQVTLRAETESSATTTLPTGHNHKKLWSVKLTWHLVSDDVFLEVLLNIESVYVTPSCILAFYRNVQIQKILEQHNL